jgi:hypothetical protein
VPARAGGLKTATLASTSTRLDANRESRMVGAGILMKSFNLIQMRKSARHQQGDCGEAAWRNFRSPAVGPRPEVRGNPAVVRAIEKHPSGVQCVSAEIRMGATAKGPNWAMKHRLFR